MRKKERVAVLFGGQSPEYGVSLQSACAVLEHMDPERYEPVPVGITRDGRWYHFAGQPDTIAQDRWLEEAVCTPLAWSLSRSEPGLVLLEAGGTRRLPLDAAFPVLHGKNGEDGTVQGLLELAGIPVVGCGVLSSALCMDKDRAHRLVRDAGVAVPRSFLVEAERGKEAPARAEELGYPLFVKPVRAGSSYGVTRVTEADQLADALEHAFAYDGRVLLEEAVSGFEVGCAVLGNEVLTVGVPDEIELAGGFFDFREKYTLETSRIHVPARVPGETLRAIQETAKTVYRALDCRGFARVDLFLNEEGQLVFNEVNTIPGFTAHSRFPTMMQAAGVSFSELISRVIGLAIRG